MPANRKGQPHCHYPYESPASNRDLCGGSKGFEKEAPYDRIILTAASKEFPKELLVQLKQGGIIVGPVGSKLEQEMVRGIKDKDNRLSLEFLGQFLFTPMYGKYGFED